MKVQLVRHATLVVEIKGLRLLVDPMFSDKAAMDPSPNTVPLLKNPLVDLPDGLDLRGLQSVDAVVITHTHRDHWDDAAVRLLPVNIPIFCQPQDSEKILDAGFLNVTAVIDTLTWNGVRMTRTRAMHGTGEMAAKMGPVSGFVLEALNEPSLYITGDTVWCKEVEDVCRLQPDVVVAFAGGAEFTAGGPITMTAQNVHKLSTALPNSRIVAVHMEAWNHCAVRREDLRVYLREHGVDVDKQVLIPNDGETMTFVSEGNP